MNHAKDGAPFGRPLAEQVADALEARIWHGSLSAIVRSHRDYCGHGLFHDRANGTYFLARAEDGLPRGDNLVTFDERERFIDWLACESDWSLSGHAQSDNNSFQRDAGNQRINRDFLMAALQGKAV